MKNKNTTNAVNNKNVDNTNTNNNSSPLSLLSIIRTINLGLSKNKYMAYALIASFPIFCLLLIYIMPHNPSIPNLSSLQQASGKFEYTIEDPKKKYGKYLIEGEEFNCAQVLRSYPFDNCYITDEVKAFQGQIVHAMWYKQKIGFSYIPILVDMTFDGDIKIIGIEDTQKVLNKLYKKNQVIFNNMVPIMFLVYFSMIFITLYLIYIAQAKNNK